jgi:hypothetical protein
MSAQYQSGIVLRVRCAVLAMDGSAGGSDCAHAPRREFSVDRNEGGVVAKSGGAIP